MTVGRLLRLFTLAGRAVFGLAAGVAGATLVASGSARRTLLFSSADEGSSVPVRTAVSVEDA
jgi:hypothetical protein